MTDQHKRAGQALAAQRGHDYMSELGRKGAIKFWQLYRLQLSGTSDFAIVRRCDGQIVAYMSGKHIPPKDDPAIPF